MADIEEKRSNSLEDEKYDVEAKHGARHLDEKEILEAIGTAFDDPNLDPTMLVDLEDDSPYPEVRSAVANTDDPDMPVNTLRAWILGLFWAILISGLNQFFFFRYPSVNLSNLVAQLLSYPMGRAFALVLPNIRIFGAELNPGPFTIKEHVLVTIMATVGSQSAYAVRLPRIIESNCINRRSFADRRHCRAARVLRSSLELQLCVSSHYSHFIYCSRSVGPRSDQWLLVMSTQLIGFSIGGIAKRFLVAPPSMSESCSLSIHFVL
jgi:hypothetical protein